jgi:WD40 repeat protein
MAAAAVRDLLLAQRDPLQPRSAWRNYLLSVRAATDDLLAEASAIEPCAALPPAAIEAILTHVRDPATFATAGALSRAWRAAATGPLAHKWMQFYIEAFGTSVDGLSNWDGDETAPSQGTALNPPPMGAGWHARYEERRLMSSWLNPASMVRSRRGVGHAGAVRCVSVSPEARLLASASEDGTVRVWSLRPPGAGDGLKPEARGRFLSCMRSYDAHGTRVHCVAIGPGSSPLIASGSAGRAIRVWDAETGEGRQALLGHRGPVRCLAWLPDGSLVSGSEDHTVCKWNLDHGGAGGAGGGSGGSGSGSGSSSSGGRGAASAPGPEMTLPGHSGTVTGLCHVPWVVVGLGGPVAAAAKSQSKKAVAPTSDFAAESPSYPGEANGGGDGGGGGGGGVASMGAAGSSGAEEAIMADPKQLLLLTSSMDGTARLWDLASGMTLRTYRGHDSAVYAVTCTERSGGLVATGSSDETVRIYELVSGRATHVLRGHEGTVWSVAFVGAGLCSGADDASVRVWDLERRACMRKIRDLHAVAIHSMVATRSRLYTAGGDHTVRVSVFGTPLLRYRASAAAAASAGTKNQGARGDNCNGGGGRGASPSEALSSLSPALSAGSQGARSGISNDDNDNVDNDNASDALAKVAALAEEI